MAERFPHLFSPIEILKLTAKNRLLMQAHSTRGSAKRHLRYLEERARGGAGLIVVNDLTVANVPVCQGRFVPSMGNDADVQLPHPGTPEGIAFFDSVATPALREQAEIAHRYGALCFCQVCQMGANWIHSNWQASIAPSTVVDPFRCVVPHELEVDEIKAVVAAHGQAARRIKEAGLDGIELHGCNGYLIQQFMSPYTNRRIDQYGGSFEKRLRFVLEIIESMRNQVGRDFPIGFRTIGDEFTEGGLTLRDIQQIVQKLADKIDYVNITAGSSTGLKDGVKFPLSAPWYVPLGVTSPLAAAIREVVDIPVVVGQRINDPVQAERILAEGQADIIGMARAFIADPEFANKAREGRLDDIRKCIGCNLGCRHSFLVRYSPGIPVACTVNAAANREQEMELKPATAKKRVLVVGGGPAGLEAARVARLRGHEVTLCERRNVLGGHIAIMALDPRRQDWAELTRFLTLQVRKLGVETKLGVEVTAEFVDKMKPDAVVIATGSLPYIPEVPGVDSPNVMTAWQVLQGKATVGDRVLVVAGLNTFLEPPSIAEFLADKGKKVEVIAEPLIVGQDIEPGTFYMLTRRLLEKGVVLTPTTKLKTINGSSVEVANTLTKQVRTIEAIDTVVLAAGTRADNQLYRSLNGKVKELYAAGDCLAPRWPLHAVHEGSRVGLRV